jgi:hypothetical protein
VLTGTKRLHDQWSVRPPLSEDGNSFDVRNQHRLEVVERPSEAFGGHQQSGTVQVPFTTSDRCGQVIALLCGGP